MATSIPEAFNKLKSNLSVTNIQEFTISDRQKAVREVVEKQFKVEKSFLTGSYQRSTAIPPLSELDVDIFVVLEPSYFHANKPSQLLDKVRSALPERYPRTPKIRRNGQAVTIRFADFGVDVVPAFNRRGGGFLIPDSKSETWISTDPKVHTEHLTRENTKHDGLLVPLVKMAKAWNRGINGAFSGFYLELLTAHVLSKSKVHDLAGGISLVLDKGREAVRDSMADPTGFGTVRGLEAVTTTADAVDRFKTAYDRAQRALDFDRRGYTSRAFEEWRSVFGDYFPTYG
jgi:predicted nucleotidyltransferase